MTQTVTLANGVEMPLVGLGTWQMSGRRAYDAIRAALEAGYRHIDTATMYGNESEVGRALRDSGIPREEVFLTTKLPPERAGRETETLAASLRGLGTDYLDLWLVHWPVRRPGPTWEFFVEAQAKGATRAIGVSNHSAAQIDELATATGATPAVNQIPWSPWDFSAPVLDAMAERGVIVEGYSPFKRSDLADPVLIEIAAAHGVTPAQVVLRWHIEHGIVVIPKSVTPDRIAANLALFTFALTPTETTRINDLGSNGPETGTIRPKITGD